MKCTKCHNKEEMLKILLDDRRNPHIYVHYCDVCGFSKTELEHKKKKQSG